MKGAGKFKGGAVEDALGEVDEQTRVGPIPLTVKRARVSTPIEFELPVVASIDVDLGTPAPLPFPITIAAKAISPSRSAARTPSTSSTPSTSLPANNWGALAMQPRPPSPSRPYPIRPTPTFSFTDGPERNPMWTQPPPQQRGRSGPGLFAIGVLMAVAGVGGYMTVKYHAWQEIEPLVARAKELGRSLRTLAPSASPESPVAAPAAAPGASATGSGAAPAPQVLRPTVVPIEPASPPATKPATTKQALAKQSTAKPATTKLTSATRAADATKRRSPERRHRRTLQPLSDEAAAEEALLAGPSRGR